MAQITKKTLIGDMLSMDSGIVPYLLNAGMHCVGCPSAQGETLEEAGWVHNMEVDDLVDQINAYLSRKEAQPAK